MDSYFVGVFSDGTKTFCCIENQDGKLVSEGEAKSSNIAYSVNITWESIVSAINKALKKNDLTIPLKELSVSVGLIGTELPESYARIISIGEKNFKQFKIYSDGYVSYKAVFSEASGILIVADEGIVAYTQGENGFRKVGGWGFPQADEGSASWIGAQAINHTFKVCDEVDQKSALSEAILSRFHHSGLELCEFSMRHSAPRDFAEFYDLVIICYKEKDRAACSIIARAVTIISKLIEELDIYNKKKHPIYFDGKMKNVLNTEYEHKNRLKKIGVNYGDKAKAAITLLRQSI